MTEPYIPTEKRSIYEHHTRHHAGINKKHGVVRYWFFDGIDPSKRITVRPSFIEWLKETGKRPGDPFTAFEYHDWLEHKRRDARHDHQNQRI